MVKIEMVNKQSENIVTILCQGSMKAIAQHLMEDKAYPGLNSRPNIDKISADCLKQVLFQDMQRFINNDLRDASESNLGEAWLRTMVYVQCNAWAFESLSLAVEKININ